MAKNRFEQVDAPVADAMTLLLARRGEEAVGRVTCPAELSEGKLSEDLLSDEMPAKDAFSSAIRLANEMRVPIAVVDPDNVWVAEWGDLYREDEEG